MSMVLGVSGLVLGGPVGVVETAAFMMLLVPLFRVLVGPIETGLLSGSPYGSWFVVLTLWVASLCLLVDFGLAHKGRYFRAVGVLIMVMLLSFVVSTGFQFYFLFEVCLVPISFMILMGGVRPERVAAIFYMVVYTVVGGAFHLFGLVGVSKWMGTTSFLVADLMFPTSLGGQWAVLLFLAFFVKCPLYGVHLWLPKAHVEASTSGSMVLAAVMLKLGVYGIFRFSALLVRPQEWGSLWQGVGVVGGVVASLMAMRSPDLKSVVAYSSVAHMSLCVAAAATGTVVGILGAFLLGVAHGLSSSGLFAWVGGVGESVGTRTTLAIAGLRSYGMFHLVVFVLLFMFSSGIPPFFSFPPEVFIWASLWSQNGVLVVGLLAAGGVVGLVLFLLIFLKGLVGDLQEVSQPQPIRLVSVFFVHLVLGVALYIFPSSLTSWA